MAILAITACSVGSGTSAPWVRLIPERRVIVDLPVRLLVAQRGGGPLHDHVPLKFGEAGQHGNKHLAHAAGGIDRLPAHVHQVQDDAGALPFLDTAQRVHGVAEEPVQLQGNNVTDAGRGELSDAGTLRPLVQLDLRRHSPLADDLDQLQSLQLAVQADPLFLRVHGKTLLPRGHADIRHGLGALRLPSHGPSVRQHTRFCQRSNVLIQNNCEQDMEGQLLRRGFKLRVPKFVPRRCLFGRFVICGRI